MRTKGVLISKDQLLDAAEAVVLRDGIGSLTFDAVAEEGGVSKGALVYHFNSKTGMVGAMTQRIADRWEREFGDEIARTPEGPGRVARAFLNYCMCDPNSWSESLRRNSQVLLAAVTHDRQSIEPVRRVFERFYAMADDDGLPPSVSRAVIAAADGVWFYWTIGLVEVRPETVNQMRSVLQGVIDDAIARVKRSGAPPS